MSLGIRVGCIEPTLLRLVHKCSSNHRRVGRMTSAEHVVYLFLNVFWSRGGGMEMRERVCVILNRTRTNFGPGSFGKGNVSDKE